MCQSNYSSPITLSFIMVLIMLSKWSWTNDTNVPNSQINFWKMKPKLLVLDKLQVNRRKIVPRIRLNRVTFPTNEALTTIIAARKKNGAIAHTHTHRQKENVNQNILRLSRKQSFLIIRIVCVVLSMTLFATFWLHSNTMGGNENFVFFFRCFIFTVTMFCLIGSMSSGRKWWKWFSQRLWLYHSRIQYYCSERPLTIQRNIMFLLHIYNLFAS